MTRTAFLALLSLLLACGGPSSEETEPTGDGDGDQLAEGGESPPDTQEDSMNPCPEGAETPCTEGVDGTRGAITDAGVPEGTDAGGEAEAESDGGEATAEEPEVPWRNRVGAGRAVFDRICGTCHPEGEEDIGPDIRRKHLSVDRVTTLIRNGRGRMRPIPERRLPDRYMDELMAYLSTLGTVRGVRRPQE